ncbi:MAG TPA: hypothetical protein D7I11_07845 [Candidatus Poseidoniales archaeon]|nr:hypothetical protein [Euryarchaeota archaeon]DAC52791.1 MAG TPA: hypothetical protein D7I11_07845 [Candidatus Poseidoniales archaeon]
MRCEAMMTIRFSELGDDIRADLQGKRWLLLSGEELLHATAALAFSELEDVLVAVDHRGSEVQIGLWMRATHLLLVDDDALANELRTTSGITRVIASKADVETHLW